MGAMIFYFMSILDDLVDLVNMVRTGKLHPVIFLLIVIFVFLFLKGLEKLVNFLNKKINE